MAQAQDVNHRRALCPLADHVVNVIEAARRAHADGRVRLDDRQLAFLEGARGLVLDGLRAEEQLLAEFLAAAALKLLHSMRRP